MGLRRSERKAERTDVSEIISATVQPACACAPARERESRSYCQKHGEDYLHKSTTGDKRMYRMNRLECAYSETSRKLGGRRSKTERIYISRRG